MNRAIFPKFTVLAAVLACGPAPRNPSSTEIRVALRPYVLRIDDDAVHLSCDPAGDRPAPSWSLRCAHGALPVDEVERIGRIAVANARRAAGGDTDALSTIVRIDIAFGLDSGDAEATIARLEELATRTGDSAGTQHLLAVAYAARAELNDDPLDLFRALDAANRATIAGPGSPAALFNRAALLESTQLTHTAIAAWHRYLDLGEAGAWAEEARARVSVLEREPSRSHRPMGERAIASALGDWSHAILDADPAAARAALRLARLQADSLERTTGDRSASLSVADIGAVGARDEMRVANALDARERGGRLFEAGSFAEAREPLRTSVEMLQDAPALRAWSEMLDAALDVYNGNLDGAEATYVRVAAAADASGNDAVVARAAWGLGLLYGRQGRVTDALAQYAIARRIHELHADTENLGALQFLLGEMHGLTGQRRSAMAHIHHSLTSLHSYPSSPHRHNALLYLLSELSRAGLHHAALDVGAEDVSIAGRTGRPKDLAEARAWLARAEVAAGRAESATSHLRDAREGVGRLSDALMQERLEIDIAQTSALLLLGAGRPSNAIEQLTRAIGYFERQQNVKLVAPLMAQRAQAMLQRGDTLSALRDLDAAIIMVNREVGFAATMDARQAVLDATQPVFDAMIGLRSARGDIGPALMYLEQSRGTDGADRLPPPDGDVAMLDYAVLEDRTLLWTITSDSTRMHVIRRSRSQLIGDADRLTNLITGVGDTAAMHEHAKRLHERLVAPATEDVQGRRRIIIVADGPLHRIPFAALEDAAGNVLARDFTITYASAATYRPAPASPRRPFTHPLFVSDPLYDRAVFADLQPLRAAAAEVNALADSFEGSDVLRGTEATRAAIRARIEGRDLFHFAGHARFRPDRPDLSHLVLARDDVATDDALYARDIAAMDLSSLELAVLSACRTQESADSRTGGFNGLSRAFLEAGAHGVVGTLWPIDDAATVSFMIRFYSFLGAGESPPDALRNTQLAMLSESDPKLRSPSLWSAFVYEGR